MSRFYTTAEVATRYRAAQSTVRFWRHTGYGPKGVKVGRRVLYAEDELLRFERSLEEDQVPQHERTTSTSAASAANDNSARAATQALFVEHPTSSA